MIRFRAPYDYHTILEGRLLKIVETSGGDKLYVIQTAFQKLVVTHYRIIKMPQVEGELGDWM